jgi:hypothetical protein
MIYYRRPVDLIATDRDAVSGVLQRTRRWISVRTYLGTHSTKVRETAARDSCLSKVQPYVRGVRSCIDVAESLSNAVGRADTVLTLYGAWVSEA